MKGLIKLPGRVQADITSLTLPEGMTEKEWLAAGEALCRVEGGVQWWIGDWWVYGEHHYGDRKALVESPDWKGPSFQACANAASVARAFETSRRREVLTFSHHVEVASLPPEQADALLDEVEANGSSVRETRQAVRRKQQALIAPPVLPDGKFGTIVIDPPWEMEKIEREVRPNQKGFDYPTMTEADLLAFGSKVKDAAADDCHLFMWTTHKHLPMALRILDAWGFRYVLTMVWHKAGGFQPVGLPQYNCEFALYARKGSPQFIDTKDFDCCFLAARREHSRKPDEFFDVVRRVTVGPRIDMFSREQRDGFEQFGNETAKFGEAA